MASCHSCTAAHIKRLEYRIIIYTCAVHMVGGCYYGNMCCAHGRCCYYGNTCFAQGYGDGCYAAHAVHKAMVVVVTMATELVYQVHCIHVKCTV